MHRKGPKAFLGRRHMPLTVCICLARRLHSACSIFREVRGHGEVSVFIWVGACPMNTLVTCPECKEKLESCICFSHHRWGSGNQQLLPSESMDGMGFQRGVCAARRGKELFLGEPANHAPFWSLTGRRALAAGRQPCSRARVTITPRCTQQSKSHSHICANSFNSPVKEWGLLSPVQDKRTIPPVLLSPNGLLIFSLGSITSSLKEEGYYHLEALYASSFQTLPSHFPWAGSHFRFASWDSAPGLIPAPEPSFVSERAGYSRGTLQCALTQVVLGEVLLDFCKEVGSDSGKAVIFSSFWCLYPGEWVACLRIFLVLVAVARSDIIFALPMPFVLNLYLWLKI